MDGQALTATRRDWNQQQKVLRQALESRASAPNALREALDLCRRQHGIVHSAAVTSPATWSFEDAILDGMGEEQIRHIPKNREHSIVWVLWHLARIEDITMNILVSGQPQVLNRDGWRGRIKSPFHETGNGLIPADVARLSQSVDIASLRAYRVAVGRRTQEIITELNPDELHGKVEPTRVQRLIEEDAVAKSATDVIDYWRTRDIAGLLLMPATRHNFLHLNEALELKARAR